MPATQAIGIPDLVGTSLTSQDGPPAEGDDNMDDLEVPVDVGAMDVDSDSDDQSSELDSEMRTDDEWEVSEEDYDEPTVISADVEGSDSCDDDGFADF
jgi:hypothetical protein